MRIILTLLLIGGSIVALSGVEAQTRTSLSAQGIDPRGAAELTVCTQNLNNYGLYADVKVRVPGMTPTRFRQKEQALVSRMVKAECDVVAVQEIVAGSEEKAREALGKLGEALHEASGRFFEPVVGTSSDRYLRVGFLVARDRAEVVNKLTYADIELPKFSEKQKPRFFAREPLEVQLNVKPLADSAAKVVTLITFHFKSKSSGGSSDPTGLEFEPYRMEMAEALRRLVELRHGEALASGRAILVLLGDRNSNYDSASAKMLEGVLQLKDFQGSAACRLSKRGVPLCKAGIARPQTLFSPVTGDPTLKNRPGTYQYKRVYSWIDDISMPAVALPFAWEGPATTGNYDAGIIYEPRDASDHALVWLRLNW